MVMGGLHGKLPPSDLRDLCNRTSFDEKELKTWHEKFKKEYPSGSITKQDFIKLYRGFYKSGDAKKFSEHVFRVFDANNDGKIGKLPVYSQQSTSYIGAVLDHPIDVLY